MDVRILGDGGGLPSSSASGQPLLRSRWRARNEDRRTVIDERSLHQIRLFHKEGGDLFGRLIGIRIKIERTEPRILANKMCWILCEPLRQVD